MRNWLFIHSVLCNECTEGERQTRVGEITDVFFFFFLACWNFKSLCQISEQGGICLICGKLEKGSDITQEGDESQCTQTGTAKNTRSKARSEGSTAHQAKDRYRDK